VIYDNPLRKHLSVAAVPAIAGATINPFLAQGGVAQQFGLISPAWRKDHVGPDARQTGADALSAPTARLRVTRRTVAERTACGRDQPPISGWKPWFISSDAHARSPMICRWPGA